MDKGIFSSEKTTRPNTQKKNKATSRRGLEGLESFEADDTSTIIISVTENRAREVCISKLETANISVLELFLISDTHSYVEVLSTIEDLSPHEILLHDGAKNSILSKKIENMCRNMESRVIFISRQYFDQDRGAELLKKILVGKVDADIIAKYAVLAGTYCLLRYLENCSGLVHAAHSLRLEYGSVSGGNDRMSIDRRTAICLELTNNAKTGSQKSSLFGIINFTKTVVGARLLRSNILRPVTDTVTLNTRFDCIELLLSNAKLFKELLQSLSQFPDLDKMLAGLTTVPKTTTFRTARRGIDTLIYLKHTLKQSQDLAFKFLAIAQFHLSPSDSSRCSESLEVIL